MSFVYGKTPPDAKIIIKGVYDINTTLVSTNLAVAHNSLMACLMPPALFEHA